MFQRRTFHLGCWMKRGMPRRLLLLMHNKRLVLKGRVIPQPEVLLEVRVRVHPRDLNLKRKLPSLSSWGLEGQQLYRL
nr:hypothetical protein Iba_chr01bCG10840 [Ipomoea batatas]